MFPPLFFKKIGQGPPLIILHGLFGSGDNWYTLAKQWSKDYEVYIVDQRNHGNSFHHDVFNYTEMANDVKRLIEEENIQSAIVLGHSMGGKTAMKLATSFPELIDKLIIADITPKYYPPHHEDVIAGFESLKLGEINSRKEADDILTKIIDNWGIRQFMLKNLGRDEEGNFIWKMNLPIIKNQIENVGEPLGQGKKFDKPTLFVRGGQSNYIEDNDIPLIKTIFTRATLETIHEAGHWLHAEQPKPFFDIVNKFLES